MRPLAPSVPVLRRYAKNEDTNTTSTLSTRPIWRIDCANEAIADFRVFSVFQRGAARAGGGAADGARQREAASDTQHRVHPATTAEGGSGHES